MAGDDNIVMTRAELNHLVDEAASKAARQVLKEIGLDDNEAGNDIRELRGLLSSWREVRKSTLQAVVKFLTTAILGAVLLGVGIRIGASSFLK